MKKKYSVFCVCCCVVLVLIFNECFQTSPCFLSVLKTIKTKRVLHRLPRVNGLRHSLWCRVSIHCSLSLDTGSQPSTSKSADAQESSSEYHCPICLDSLTQIKSANIQMNSTMCGHVFCKPCITQVVASTKMCPTCRNDLRLDQLISIFL